MNIAQSAVGSTVANCTHVLANYTQLANPCQLESLANQGAAGVPPSIDWTRICSSCGLSDGISLPGFKG
jgi:hypothetical protein